MYGEESQQKKDALFFQGRIRVFRGPAVPLPAGFELSPLSEAPHCLAPTGFVFGNV